MSKKRKVVSAVAALSLAATMAPSVNAAKSNYHTTKYSSSYGQYYTDDYGNKVYDDFIIDQNGQKHYDYQLDNKDNAIINYDCFNSYEDYKRYENTHLNVEIADDDVFNRVVTAHRENCNDYRCRMGYEQFIVNHGQNQINNSVNNNWNQNQVPTTNNKLYTVVKTQNGVTKYAYSPVENVANYGIYGWNLNSTYNENDLDLNSVFYEEINTFGNDFRWNYDVVNTINNTHNLYVWSYNMNGETKYCVSPNKYPQNNEFTYNSDFNINDVNVELKTSYKAMIEKAYIRGLFR